MNDVFRFLALAVAVGLAAGMLLGGIALLLAAPAYASPSRAAICTPAVKPADAPSHRLWVAYRR